MSRSITSCGHGRSDKVRYRKGDDDNTGDNDHDNKGDDDNTGHGRSDDNTGDNDHDNKGDDDNNGPIYPSLTPNATLLPRFADVKCSVFVLRCQPKMTPGMVESLAKMRHARPKLLGTSTQHGAPLQQQTRQSVYQSAWRDKCDDHDGKSFIEAAPLAAAIPARRFVIKVLHDALNVDDIIGVQADGDPFAVQEVRNSAILSHLTDITQDLGLWL